MAGFQLTELLLLTCLQLLQRTLCAFYYSGISGEASVESISSKSEYILCSLKYFPLQKSHLLNFYIIHYFAVLFCLAHPYYCLYFALHDAHINRNAFSSLLISGASSQAIPGGLRGELLCGITESTPKIPTPPSAASLGVRHFIITGGFFWHFKMALNIRVYF